MDRRTLARHRSVIKIVHGGRRAEHGAKVPKRRPEFRKTRKTTHLSSELIAVRKHLHRIDIARVQICETTFHFRSVLKMSFFDIQGRSESSRKLADEIIRLDLADGGDIADDGTRHPDGEKTIESDVADPHVEILEFGFPKRQLLEFRSITDSGDDEIRLDGQYLFRAEVKVVAKGRIAVPTDDLDSPLRDVLEEVIAFVVIHIEQAIFR